MRFCDFGHTRRITFHFLLLFLYFDLNKVRNVEGVSSSLSSEPSSNSTLLATLNALPKGKKNYAQTFEPEDDKRDEEESADENETQYDTYFSQSSPNNSDIIDSSATHSDQKMNNPLNELHILTTVYRGFTFRVSIVRIKELVNGSQINLIYRQIDDFEDYYQVTTSEIRQIF